jgi:hypothetical protein
VLWKGRLGSFLALLDQYFSHVLGVPEILVRIDRR